MEAALEWLNDNWGYIAFFGGAWWVQYRIQKERMFIDDQVFQLGDKGGATDAEMMLAYRLNEILLIGYCTVAVLVAIAVLLAYATFN